MGCEEPIACARIGRPTNSQAEANQTKQGGKFECFFFSYFLYLLLLVQTFCLFVLFRCAFNGLRLACVSVSSENNGTFVRFVHASEHLSGVVRFLGGMT